MFEMFKRWGKGVEVSELSIVLPFVQITLRPSDDDVNPPETIQSVSKKVQSSAQINLEIAHEITQDFDTTELLSAYYFQTPTRIDHVSTIYERDSRAKLRTYRMLDCPVFDKYDWQDLSGSVVMRANDTVWFVALYKNVSEKILYNVPFSFASLPFLKGVYGYIRTPKGFLYVNDVTKTQKLEYLNPYDSVIFHCVCKIPKTFTKSMRFNLVNYEGVIFNDRNERLSRKGYYVEKLIQENYNGPDPSILD